jgi:hypothetical protein
VTREPEKRYFLSWLAHGEPPPPGAPELFFHPLRTFNTLGQYRLFASPEAYREDGVLPALRAMVDYMAGLENDRGLIVKLGTPQWVDWNWMHPKGDMALQNLYHILLLRHLADAEDSAGNREAAAPLRAKADRIADVIYREYWNAGRGLYVDAVADGVQQTRFFSEHTNVLALLAGLGKDGRDEIIFEKLANGGADLAPTDYAMISDLVKACFASGRAEEGLEILRERFGYMLKADKNPTLWETESYLIMGVHSARGRWPTELSALAQSASCIPAYLLSTEVLGIKPTKRGFAEFAINPQPGGLNWAEGVMPSPLGDIPVRWERKEGRFLVDLNVPEGSRAQVHFPSGGRIELDGAAFGNVEPVDGRSIVPIGPGKHRLAWQR